MPIDGCRHSFRKLATRVLPTHMKALRRSMTKAKPLKDFDTQGLGLRGIMKSLGVDRDFSGCYVLMQGKRPVYVGISRRVLHRVYSHIRGTSHFTATLAYHMASAETNRDLSRSEQMQQEPFLRSFSRKKEQMRSWRVAWVAIENPVELHLFEVFCAMEFNTYKWNTFKTH